MNVLKPMLIVVIIGFSLLSFTVFQDAHADGKIPTWVKNLSQWYGQGQISTNEFLNAMKFLVQNGIIDQNSKISQSNVNPTTSQNNKNPTTPTNSYPKKSLDMTKIPQIPDLYKKNLMSMSFKKNVFKKEDFDKWREEVVSKFREVYNIPSFEEIKIEQANKIFTVDNNNYTISKYTMKAADNDTIIFYELLPKKTNGNLLPAVFIIPGSGNQGASDVINNSTQLSKYYYHRGIGKQLVNAGYAVYVIEDRGWAERAIDTGVLCQKEDVYCSGPVLSRQLENFGENLYSLQVSDSLQVVKFIQTREYVDSKNISVAGLSLGGTITQAVSALAPDIKNTVIASGLVSIYQTTGAAIYTPGMLKYFDWPDLVSTIAPRHLYLSWGINEQTMFGYEAKTLYSANLIKKTYNLVDADDNLVIVIQNDTFNYGHTFDIPSILKFLNNTSTT